MDALANTEIGEKDITIAGIGLMRSNRCPGQGSEVLFPPGAIVGKKKLSTENR